MVMKRRLAALAAMALLLLSCVSFSSGTRAAPEPAADNSGRWNDGDSRTVAEQVIADALNQRWISKWENAGMVPTVSVGMIVNKSHEHISVQAFVKDIERALLNSGRVEFVAPDAGPKSGASEDNEPRPDLVMAGVINTIHEQEEGKAVTVYRIDLELIETESSMKVWTIEKKVRKIIER